MTPNFKIDGGSLVDFKAKVVGSDLVLWNGIVWHRRVTL